MIVLRAFILQHLIFCRQNPRDQLFGGCLSRRAGDRDHGNRKFVPMGPRQLSQGLDRIRHLNDKNLRRNIPYPFGNNDGLRPLSDRHANKIMAVKTFAFNGDEKIVFLHFSGIDGNASDFYEFEKNIQDVQLEDVKALASRAKKEYSFFHCLS